MNNKNEMIVEFVQELINLPQNLYEEAKATLLSVEAGNMRMSNFLIKAFAFVEERRPKLLETKGGVAA